MPIDHAVVTARLRELQNRIRDEVICLRGSSHLEHVQRQSTADTLYSLDIALEKVVIDYCEQWGREIPLIVVAEGIEPEAGRPFPSTCRAEDAVLRILLDPIDGTRGLMYDKRSAWSLAGAAPNRGSATRLSDIEVAVMTELPTSKMNQADVLWAVRGEGAHGERSDLATGQAAQLRLQPSDAVTLDHGFACVSSFFPGTKRLAAELAEHIAARLATDPHGLPLIFDDQYIASGGQLYELIVGHDRFIADLRALFFPMEGKPVGLCVHPYDLATMLIAEEAGVVLSDGLGRPLDGPMDVHTPLHWCGYANARLRKRIEPLVREFLDRRAQRAPRVAGPAGP